jgi:hypothetical protein
LKGIVADDRHGKPNVFWVVNVDLSMPCARYDARRAGA